VPSTELRALVIWVSRRANFVAAEERVQCYRNGSFDYPNFFESEGVVWKKNHYPAVFLSPPLSAVMLAACGSRTFQTVPARYDLYELMRRAGVQAIFENGALIVLPGSSFASPGNGQRRLECATPQPLARKQARNPMLCVGPAPPPNTWVNDGYFSSSTPPTFDMMGWLLRRLLLRTARQRRRLSRRLLFGTSSEEQLRGRNPCCRRQRGERYCDMDQKQRTTAEPKRRLLGYRLQHGRN